MDRQIEKSPGFVLTTIARRVRTARLRDATFVRMNATRIVRHAHGVGVSPPLRRLQGKLNTGLAVTVHYETKDALGRKRLLRASVSFGLRLVVSLVLAGELALLIRSLLP